jgi:hypothetical protein
MRNGSELPVTPDSGFRRIYCVPEHALEARPKASKSEPCILISSKISETPTA